MNPTYDFRGQVALVTGAGSGMGPASAIAFAHAGAAVVMVDHNQETLAATSAGITSAGGKAIGIVANVTDEAAAKAAVDRAVVAFGRLDKAYNNAGILGPMCTMVEETGNGFDRVVAVNLRGIWTFMKHELIQMRRQGSGAIVNCSSLGGLVGLPCRAAYHGTKHGVIGLTKSAALDVAAEGIRVNAICPGYIDTPMGDEIEPEAMKKFLKGQPIGRWGGPRTSPPPCSGCAALPRASCSAWLCRSTAASWCTDPWMRRSRAGRRYPFPWLRRSRVMPFPENHPCPSSLPTPARR